MQVRPVAYAFDSLEEVLSETETSAAVTHSHPEGVKGAQGAAPDLISESRSIGYTICYAGGACQMNDLDTIIKRGEAYFDEGLYARAIANYTRAIAAWADNSQLYTLRAKAYTAKAYEEAGRAPFDEDAYAKWAESLSRGGELGLALDDSLRAVALDPANADAYYGLGVILMDRRAWGGAIAAFDKCLVILPGDAEAMCWKAAIYDELGNVPAALEVLDGLLAAGAELPVAYHLRSQLRTLQEDYEGALTDASRAIELEPEGPEYYLQRAKVLSYLGEKPAGAEQLAKAVKDLSEALRLDPAFTEAYNWRSLAYLQAGDDRRELADLDALIALEPGHAEAYRRRYESRLASGDRGGAALDWLYYCQLEPGAVSEPPVEAAHVARSDFRKFSGN